MRNALMSIRIVIKPVCPFLIRAAENFRGAAVRRGCLYKGGAAKRFKKQKRSGRHWSEW